MKIQGIIFAIVVLSAAVLVGTATAEPTAPGVKAWGERLQGEARVYQQLRQGQQGGSTPLGVKAWGQRLEGEARVYQQLQQGQQQGPTALGLAAWGKRLQAEARLYRQLPRHTAVSSSSAGRFDWDDAGIGVLFGCVLAVGYIGALLVGRRFRRTQFAPLSSR